MLKTVSARAGFTLMEMLVYIALLTLLIGGTVLSAYWLLVDARDIRAKVNTDEEANFILRKIDWALSGAAAGDVAAPALGSSGGTLRLDKAGFAANPIEIDLAAGEIRIARSGGAPLPLNTANVTVADLDFYRYASSGLPEVIRTAFRMNGREFTLVKYLRP